MRFSLAMSIVALAILAAAAPQPAGEGVGMAIQISKRSGLVNLDNNTDFDALNRHVASVKAKIQQGFANFEKNTGKRHPSDVRSAERRKGHEPLRPDGIELWYGTITVGTPAKSFTVDFDTGSSDFFLPGSHCDSTCDGHTHWNPSSSSTSKKVGRTFNITFGDGSTVSCKVYTDTVSIAGFTATTQTLGAAKRYSYGFQRFQFPADGLMGMAFRSISASGSSPVFQTLISEGRVTDSVFSFKLSSSAAELYIGGSNSALYTGDFSYTPVTQRVKMDRFESNDRTILKDVDIIIDTGTTLILVPDSQISSLYKALGGQPVPSNAGLEFSGYTFPCKSFPDISLTFGGRSFNIPASALNLGVVSPGSSDCISGIVGIYTSSSFWVIGDLFLRGVYTTFDVGKSRVGFAKLA